MACAFAIAGLVVVGCGSARSDHDGCVQFQNPELQSSPPSVVRVSFQLQQCEGAAPVPAMNLPDFSLKEDGQQVSTYESEAAIIQDNRAFQQAVVILLDLSGSVLDSLPEIKTAARDLVEGLSREPQVALYTFDGRAEPELHADFTSDLGSVEAAIDAIDAERIDTSTNLNGAIVAAAHRLDERRTSVEGDGVLFAGALALFTDGTDRAGRVPEADALQAVKNSGARVFSIGLGSEIDEKYLRTLGASGGVALAEDLGGLNDAFAQVGRSISALANSYYVLAYCSPRRASSHELSVSLLGHDGDWKGKFDASGFAGGCTPDDFLRPAAP